jgi:hypothetical protein
VERYRARLVVKGFNQKEGIDFTETFAAVVRFETIRTIINIIASRQMKFLQFDVKTAFLYGTVDETIFMTQPDGYNDGTNKVCLLKKSLYGLKQAPRCWGQHFTATLKAFKMRQSKADGCVYYSHQNGLLLLGLYVDDAIVASDHQHVLDHFMKQLQSAYEMVVKPLTYFLGVHVVQTEEGIFIHQEKYINDMLTKFKLQDAKTVATPILTTCYSECAKVNNEENLSECSTKQGGSEAHSTTHNIKYRELIGSLLYSACTVRADVAFAVSYLSRFLDCYKHKHWKCAQYVLKYLGGTKRKGIMYYKHGDGQLVAYSDSDFAGCVDTRKSTTGNIILFNGSPIIWQSQRQSSVSLSTTESEYQASSECVKNLLWIQRLLKEIIHFDGVTELQMDNQSAIQLIKNPVYHKRSKHIDVRFHFIRERFEQGLFKLTYCPSAEQLADVFTKPLVKNKFLAARLAIGIREETTNNRQDAAIDNIELNYIELEKEPSKIAHKPIAYIFGWIFFMCVQASKKMWSCLLMFMLCLQNSTATYFNYSDCEYPERLCQQVMCSIFETTSKTFDRDCPVTKDICIEQASQHEVCIMRGREAVGGQLIWADYQRWRSSMTTSTSTTTTTTTSKPTSTRGVSTSTHSPAPASTGQPTPSLPATTHWNTFGIFILFGIILITLILFLIRRRSSIYTPLQATHNNTAELQDIHL